MKYAKGKCQTTVESKGIIYIHTLPCPHTAKFEITYNRGTDNKRVTSIVCGKHLQSHKAWIKRMDKIRFEHNSVIKQIEK